MREIFTTYSALEPMPTVKEISNNSDIGNFIDPSISAKIINKSKELIDNFHNKESKEREKSKSTDKQKPKKSPLKYNFVSDINGNIKTAFSFFIQKGLLPHQAAGIVGNLQAESGLNPKIYNKAEKAKGYAGYGRGIAQWSNSRVNDFKEYVGVDVLDATLWQQLEFMWHEMEQRPAFMEAIRKASNVKEATDAMLRGYENGSAKGLLSVDKYNALYKNNPLNGHDYEYSLNKRSALATSIYDNIMRPKRLEEGGKLTYKYQQGGSLNSKYANTLMQYAKVDPNLFFNDSANSLKVRNWLRINNREDILVEAYKNKGITDRAQMPLISSAYWQKHPVGGKNFTKEVNQLASIPYKVLDTASDFTPVIGDAKDMYRIGKDVKNKNYASAAIGLGLLALPNIIEKPVKAIKNASKALRIKSEYFNTNNLDLSKVDYNIYDRSKTDGYNNKAIKIFIKDNPNFGYFELVKDNEPDFYSVYFKTGDADTGMTFGSTPEQRQLLYEQIRNILPEGSKISTWGNVSKGGVKALNKVGKGYTKIGTRKVNDREGNELIIPIFQKNTTPESMSTINQLIPENQAPIELQNILPERNEYGVYSSEDLEKINKAKKRERIEMLIGRTPLNYFYKEGVDFTRRNPTEEELLTIKERNFPRIDQMRPEKTDAELKKEHDYIIDQLKKVNVVEYSKDMMKDCNDIDTGAKARAFSLSNYPTIAIIKNSPTSKIDILHELRHQIQHMLTRTDSEQDLFKKAFGDFKYRNDYAIDKEYETMTTDARNSMLDWCKKEYGDKYAEGSPIDYSDIEQQNYLIDNIPAEDFLNILYNSDGYWKIYLNQIRDKYSFIPSDKIKDFKEVIFKTGILATPMLINNNNKDN